MLIRNSHFWSRCSTSNESSGATEPFVCSQRSGQKNWQRCCACPEFISYFGPRTSNLASLGSTPNKRSEHRNFYSESPVTRQKWTRLGRFQSFHLHYPCRSESSVVVVKAASVHALCAVSVHDRSRSVHADSRSFTVIHTNSRYFKAPLPQDALRQKIKTAQ